MQRGEVVDRDEQVDGVEVVFGVLGEGVSPAHQAVVRWDQLSHYIPLTTFVPGFDRCLTIAVSVDASPHIILTCRALKTHTMINTPRLFRSSLLACLFCGAFRRFPSWPKPPLISPPDGGHRHGPPPNVLFDALDANHDGVLSPPRKSPTLLPCSRDCSRTEKPQLTRADLRPENKDAQTPAQRSEREDGHWQHQHPDNDQAAGDEAVAHSAIATEPMDYPHDHRRFTMDDPGMPLPWRHHFRHDGDGQPWQRPARVKHGDERREGDQRSDRDLDGQSDEPHPHRFHSLRRFEAQADEQDEMGDAAEMDQIRAELHRLAREVHQLKEAHGMPAPAQR